MLVSILQHVRPAIAVLSMYEICTTWRAALLDADEKDIEAIWCTLAAERFPIAAQILKHVPQPAPGLQLYRSQLKHEKARDPDSRIFSKPCSTTLNGYLFHVEWEFLTVDQVARDVTTHDKGRWAGFLQEYGSEARLRVPLELAQPDWVETAHDLDARVRVQISVTNLATLKTILLCREAELSFDAVAGTEIKLPMQCGTRNVVQTTQLRFECRFGQDVYNGCSSRLVWEGHQPRRLALQFHYGLDSNRDPLKERMEPHHILYYLEHVAPWHLG